MPAAPPAVELGPDQARRIAVRAQGLGAPRPASPTAADLEELVQRLAVVQIDAVNTLVRSHYLPAFSRLGPYPRAWMDDLAYERRVTYDTWGHVASFVTTDLYPALGWRRAHYARGSRWVAFLTYVEAERPGYLDDVVRQVTERGPLAFTDLDDPGRRAKVPGHYAESSLRWWRPADGKEIMGGLWRAGRLAVAGRRNFERLFDLPERVLPAGVLGAPEPAVEDAQRELVRRSITALGLASDGALADYFRLPVAATRARARELAEEGVLVPARVAGSPARYHLAAGADDGPAVGAALLSPFDSLLWDRRRARDLFGFDHVFELYVPAARRRYGYFVLPFLVGDRLVGRVDVTADRASGALVVVARHHEDGVDPAAADGPLAAELAALATWLELDRVVGL
ncbi:MAG TPA: crosslink repair DNA glycosylase YcaQ family protein [Acidimicrobiales bacterium]|jgi:hypothetical protein